MKKKGFFERTKNVTWVPGNLGAGESCTTVSLFFTPFFFLCFGLTPTAAGTGNRKPGGTPAPAPASKSSMSSIWSHSSACVCGREIGVQDEKLKGFGRHPFWVEPNVLGPRKNYSYKKIKITLHIKHLWCIIIGSYIFNKFIIRTYIFSKFIIRNYIWCV